MIDELHVGEQFATASHQEGSASEQIARSPHFARVDVAERKRAAPHQAGDLFAVDPIVLVLAAVDGFHVQGVAEDEVETFVQTEIGQPVPGEHAFHADDEPVAEGFDGSQEVLRFASHVAVEHLVPLAIEDAQIHLPCVQIDTTIEFVLLLVESHHGPPWEVEPEPQNQSKAQAVF